ncbi:hypothetical protein PC129_g6636 [Phytophthora cactorum]|uniref:Uncharacterized protein n=1 Tax=Phytophthora cactorum TaxID=29920 RepID=A0A8T1CPW0_9STRA|nr:hypothetical protein Pcac1_g731 [Phytophthora cactorum]KAG2828026.1 hypothetical protein PC112_g8632 [Phytophthora cactorum]KAG2836499.1 hypothetical protein PC111_g5017 [Phytophthora cactorum]KAG2859075.1 hypothetical protein PC113_g9259 [Phytophthora cactorum]KAG2912298.1 hypothetical protein PC114_g8952 [Phytophthora cactorum]
MARARRRHAPPTANTAMSARKSAPVSAGGVNVRRLMLSRVAEMEHKREEEEELEQEDSMELSNECENPFCRQIMANRYTRFCEDKPMCQRYRALKLQCLANAQAEENEEDTRPLALVLKWRKKREEKKENEVFAIPRKKTEAPTTGKKRLDLSGERSSSSSPRRKEKKKKKREVEEQEEKEKKQKKRLKRAREAAANNALEAASAAPSRSPSVTSTASSVEEFGTVLERKKRVRPRDPRVRQPPEVTSDVETGNDVAKLKKRRLNRHVSADDVLSRSASPSPITAESDTNWKIPRAKPARPKTVAQAIRNMNVELVPLGVANQAGVAGGGRYVQNGNRSAALSLRPSDPRTRPLSLTKFAPPAAVPPSAPASAPSRQVQTTQPTMPAPAVPQTQPPLPPLPPQTVSLAPPVSRPVRATTPSSSPAKKTAAIFSANTASSTTTRLNASTTGASGVKRISAAAYLKKKKNDSERRPQGERMDFQPSRSSSLEQSTGLPPAPAGPPRYHRSDSAPLPSYRAVDPRRQYPEADVRHQRPYYDSDGNRMEYRDRSEGRGEPSLNDRSTSAQWEARNFPPPRDRYPPRQQDVSSFGNNSYDYPADTHFSPASPPAEQPSYRREPSREQPPPPQRAPSPQVERVTSDRRSSDRDELDDDAPTFSCHEDFLPRLLSVFIHKLPQSLEAVFNVTKKPRKMNWYIKYVERIEWLCKPFNLQVKIEGLKATVTVRGREWLTLQGNSTVMLHLEIIKSLRAEAVTWLRFYEEMEKALAHYRGIYGSQANKSYTFLRAWNDLKNPGNYISLSRQANYFCGARLHHWNFVVGKVEIGSGSHEEKREAFRLATISALDFLLNIGRGVRRPSRELEVKRERVLGSERSNSRGRQRSSSRESTASNRVRASPANGQVNGASTDPSSSAPPPYTEQPSNDEPASAQPSARANPTTQPLSSAEPSSSPITVERTEKPAVAIIPTTDSNNSHGMAEATEQSDQGEEMSISDASDQVTVTPGGSPSLSTNTPSNSSSGVLPSTSEPAKPAASVTQMESDSSVPKVAASTSVVTGNSSTTPLPLTTQVGSKVPAAKIVATTAPSSVSAAVVGDGDSTSNKDTPTPQAKAKEAIPLRRCMMCEMIRMRKPDGERCLRCQQKGAPANGLLNVSLGP